MASKPTIEFLAVTPRRNPFGPAKGAKARVMSALRDAGHDAQQELQEYPPQGAGVSYVRTGELGRHWTTEGPNIVGGDIVVKVGNNMEYASLVQGRDHERVSWARSYGWPGITDVAKSVEARHLPRLRAAFKP